MQIVGAVRQCLAVKPDFALLGDSVIVGVGELPDLRRRGDVQRAVKPQRSLWKHELVGIDRALVKPSVAISIFESPDAVGAFFALHVDVFVRAAGIGDVQPSTLVEIGAHGAVDQRLPGDVLHNQAVGDSELVTVEFKLRGGGVGGQQDTRTAKDESAHSFTPVARGAC